MNIIDVLDLYSEKRINLKIRSICEYLEKELIKENNLQNCSKSQMLLFIENQHIVYNVNSCTLLWLDDNIEQAFEHIIEL